MVTTMESQSGQALDQPARLIAPIAVPRNRGTEIDRESDVVVRAEGLTIRYGDFAAVRDVILDIPSHQVTAIIGPSGCGKSTLLRAMNRMNDFIPDMGTSGRL